MYNTNRVFISSLHTLEALQYKSTSSFQWPKTSISLVSMVLLCICCQRRKQTDGELCGLVTELESLEADMGLETGTDVPSYLLPDKEPEFDSEIQLPAAPSGPAATQANPQVF